MNGAARFSFVIGLLLLGSGRSVVAQEITNEACLECHGMEGFAGEDQRPLAVKPDLFKESVHASLDCSACHSDATAIPHEAKPNHLGTEACAVCHDEVVAKYGKSIHGTARSNGDDEAATCTNCHGPVHAIKHVKDPDSPVFALNMPRTCGVCHGDPELAKRRHIPQEDPFHPFMDSVHGKALLRHGLVVAANCSTCHGSHEIRPAADPESHVYRTNIATTCGKCHTKIIKDFNSGVHGKASNAGDKRAPVCIDCHTSHWIRQVDEPAWQLELVKECGKCHEQSITTYRDTFHGHITSLGFTRLARCSDCHGSHKILPASDPESMIAPANLVNTCSKCHKGVTTNFVKYSPHADAHDPERYPLVYYTRLAMEVLIWGTFAFFGLHTALWLSRLLIEQRAKTRAANSHGEDRK